MVLTQNELREALRIVADELGYTDSRGTVLPQYISLTCPGASSRYARRMTSSTNDTCGDSYRADRTGFLPRREAPGGRYLYGRRRIYAGGSTRMTRISARKTRMQAETDVRYRGRPLVVILNGHELFIREKKRSHAYAAPYQAIYEMGMKIAANEARRAKLETRKNRRIR